MVANDEQAPSIADEDVGGMPDWAIAVVVIGLGSFAFVIVFGITVVSVECFFQKSHTYHIELCKIKYSYEFK